MRPPTYGRPRLCWCSSSTSWTGFSRLAARDGLSWDFVVLAVAGAWRLGCGGAGLAAFRAVLRLCGGRCPCCAGRQRRFVQFMDKVVFLPVVVQDRVLVQTVQPVEFRSCSSWPRCLHARCCDDRCLRVQFLAKVLTCPLLRRLVHEGAVLEQGGDMPVVATTGAWRCRRCSFCGCGRSCDQAATS